MRQIEQEISAIHEIDVAVVAIRPACRPRIHDLEVVAAVCEVRTAAHNRDMPDGEVMVVSKMRPKVRIINPLALLHMFVMPLFMSSLIMMLVPVLILSPRRHRSAQQKCPAHSTHG